MLTIGKIRGNATSEAADYYLNAAKSSKEDYYVRSGEPAGIWKGAGCEALGLKEGQVVGEELRDLLDGFHAENAQALVQNAGKEKRVAAYDMTFSAGKDLSILSGIGDDTLRQKIIDCHQSAVTRTMEFSQSNLAVTRRGKGGEEDEQVQGIAWANFNHMTSRGGERGIDPLLHDHNLVINTVRRADGTFGSLDGKRLLDHKMAMGAMYRAELIKSVQRELAIKLEVFEDRRGHYDFRIKGMTDQIRKEFSQRRDQIEAKLEEWKASKDDAAAAANATILTRQAKKAVDRDELAGQWRERAAALGLTLDAVDKITKATSEQAEREWIQDLAKKGLTDSEAQQAISDRV
jgi:conjugative relaxase-like TrwC/TraI family protein